MSSLPDETGAEIGGYRALARLGAGAAGVVYLARSTDALGKEVALKRFPPEAEVHFRRELEAYRRVEAIRRRTATPHLAEGLAASILPDGSGLIALAYHEGGSAADRVKSEGPLSCGDAVAIIADVLLALELLHEDGLCHRDVKPSNILIGADGRARLGDFGLAVPGDREISAGGTPAFAAPEQWSEPIVTTRPRDGPRGAGDASPEAATRSPIPCPGDGPLDHALMIEPETPARSGRAIDVYGAGAALYYLLTGTAPLPGRPDLLLLERRGVPRGIQEALLRALEAAPCDRWPTALEFASALREAKTPPSHSEHARQARPSRMVPAIVLAALLGGAALTWRLRERAGGARAREPAGSSASATSPSPPSLAEPPELAARTAIALGDGGRAEVRADASAGPRLLVFEPNGATRAAIPLPEPALAILALEDGRIATAGALGGVFLSDPAHKAPPRELCRFGRAALGLALDGSEIVARGDDRRALLLAEGATAPPEFTVVTGTAGRYAYARAPAIRSLRLKIPSR